MKNKDSYSPEEKEKIKQQLMKQVSKKPVTCEECHCKQGYLNYSDLGYDAARAADLSRIEIVKMIKEYKDFKFPVIFGSEKNSCDAGRLPAWFRTGQCGVSCFSTPSTNHTE